MTGDYKSPHAEAVALRKRYAKRAVGDRYSMLRPEVWMGMQERQRAMLRLFREGLRWKDLSALKLLEIGCGSGGNLLEFLRLGFRPENLSAIELLPERVAAAREVLPGGVRVYEGDATSMSLGPEAQDLVFQSVVFSSLLDDGYQAELAKRMWAWVRPGGGILWYDFTYDNPANQDVRGVPVGRIRELFTDGKILARRITLAPPISRIVCRIHPAAYHVFNCIPQLRTHVFAYIAKA